MRRYLYIILLSLVFWHLEAQTLSDSAQISLLTCTPGEEIWAKYGHTAVRVVDPSLDCDLVFNYGMFSFSVDHFIWKFVKGETDYMLGVEDAGDFYIEYAWSGRKVYEQVLELTQEQKQNIFDALLKNYEPENRVYRYNFVFDNCATRPYVLLRNALNIDLNAPMFEQRSDTYRTIISKYTGKGSWTDVGINLLFGADADAEMTTEQRLFLPEELMNYLSEAKIEGQSLVEIQQTGTFEEPNVDWKEKAWWVIALLSIALIVVTCLGLRKHKMLFGIDATLFSIYFLLGLLLTFLTCISTHPLVGHNINMLFLNPLMIVPAVLVLTKKGQEWILKDRWFTICLFGVLLITWMVYPQTPHCFIFIIIAHFTRILIMQWYGRRQRIKDANRHMKKATAIFTLLFTAIGVNAMPRLTVVTVVNGLNEQSLEEMRAYWQQGGIRTLNEDAYSASVEFPHLVYGGNECVATLLTGEMPARHGVAANTYFNKENKRPELALSDDLVSGIGTSLRVSPSALHATTISDELRLLKGEKAKIYAVGIDAQTTILMAGHAANACCWLDEKTQRWVTTNFYAEGLPAAADRMNIDGHIGEVVGTTWKHRMDIRRYLHPSEKELQMHGFTYDQATILSESPAANTLVIDLALRIQEQKDMGKDAMPDLLLIQLNVTTPESTTDLIQTAEQEDMYMRLNDEIGYLMDELNKAVGQGQYQLIVVGVPNMGRSLDMLEAAQMSCGQFNIHRATALASTYLMANYGQDRWIIGAHGQSIYLNKELIRNKHLNFEQIAQQVADFLTEFEGVDRAYPSAEIPLLQGDEEVSKARNSFDKRNMGDVFFILQENWQLLKDEGKEFDYVIETNPTVPLYIYAPLRSLMTNKRTRYDANEVKDLIMGD